MNNFISMYMFGYKTATKLIFNKKVSKQKSTLITGNVFGNVFIFGNVSEKSENLSFN